MSKLSYETMVAGLRHEDIFVRSGALVFLVESGTECREDVSFAIFDVLEKYGWEGSFVHQEYIMDLPMNEEVAKRLVSYLANKNAVSAGEVWEDQRIETCYEWFSNASPQVCQSILAEMDSMARNSQLECDVLQGVRFGISILDFDAAKCRSLLDSFITECVEGDVDPDEEIFRIQSIVKRLGQLDEIDPDEVKKWVNEDARFEDEYELTIEEMKVCVGFEMAKTARVPIPLKRCLECLNHQFQWLSDSVVETMISTCDEALLDELIKHYPKAPHLDKELYLLVFDKVRFPGREEKIRDLATLEKDLGLRSLLGLTLCFYGTDQGLKAARETVEGMDDEIESSDIIDVLYALRALKGESSPEMEQWRSMLEEIHTITLQMISGELDLSEYIDDDDLYDPMVGPDPAKWLAMDEDERMLVVREFCEDYEGGIEGISSHIAIHTVVENQIAENADDLPAGDTLKRLMKEGLNRHEAIHAIGYVVAGFLFDTAKKRETYNVKAHADKLRNLKARDWKGSAAPVPESSFSSGHGETQLRESPKTSRNDLCPCGSGKKYKKCCIKNAN